MSVCEERAIQTRSFKPHELNLDPQAHSKRTETNSISVQKFCQSFIIKSKLSMPDLFYTVLKYKDTLIHISTTVVSINKWLIDIELVLYWLMLIESL